jgi:hypothetical protein
MSDRKVQKNSIGTKIIVDTEVDISTATARKIYYKKPSVDGEEGEEGSWDASPETSTSMSFTTTVADDLDVAGAWCIQSDIESPDWSGRGKSTQLIVMDNC